VDSAEYDALHRLTASVQNYVSGVAADFQTNVRSETTYDQGGRRLTVKDPLGRVAVTAYDAIGRKLAQTANCVGSAFAVCDGPVTSDQNLTTRWLLDAGGNVLAELSPRTGGSDGIRLTTGYAYDAQLRLLQVTEDQGSSAQGHRNLLTSYGYDPAGHRLTVSDGLSHVSTTTVDGLGRATSLLDASGNLQQTQYSLAGEVVKTVNGRGQQNPLTLDRLGRVLVQGYLKADGVTAGTTSTTHGSPASSAPTPPPAPPIRAPRWPASTGSTAPTTRSASRTRAGSGPGTPPCTPCSTG
jgi:hypothetical protein